MTINQIRVGHDNFSYVIYCPNTKKAAIVDPGFDASQALRFVSSNFLCVQYVIITHYHSDHSSDVKKIKATVSNSKIVASEHDGRKIIPKADIFVSDKDEINLGKIKLKFILTPGHTPGGICIIVDNKAILTGDTLFIGDCGRTDLPGGNIADMYKTLQEKIKTLPDHLIVYPGHNYGNLLYDTLVNQKKKHNTLLAKTLEEFSRIP